MTDGRRRLRVRELAAPIPYAVVGGPFGSELVSADYVEAGVPVIRGANLSCGRWVGGDFVFVSPQKAAVLSNSAARPGDLVFTQRGTLGQVAIVPPYPYARYLLSQSQMKLTPDPRVADTRFLYYLFSAVEQRARFDEMAIRVGVPHINLGILRDFEVLLPGLSAQKAVADVLSALDDKIELNRGTVHTIDELIDVEFTRLRDAVSRHTTWGGLITMKYGKALESIEAGPFPVFGTNGQIGWTDAPLCAQPGIVVGRKGAYRGIFFSQEPFWVIDTAFFVTMKGSDDLWWAYHEMKRIRLNDMDSGSAIPSTSRDQFERLPVRVPERSTQASFRSRTWPLRLKGCALEQESRTLAELRDSLMSKLLSGALRVRDAEKIVGEVT